MTKKIYLETLKECPEVVHFPLLTGVNFAECIRTPFLQNTSG